MNNFASKTLSVLGITLVLAGLSPQTGVAAPISRVNKMVSGDQAQANVTKLMTEIPWYTSLEYAQQKAQAENKPIFWVHALGQLNGIT